MEPKIYNIGTFVDDRGTLNFSNEFNEFNKIKRFYTVSNHSVNFIRAWHGHKEEEKYIYITFGVALIGAVNLTTENIYKFTISATTPKLLYIPKNHANGFKTLKPNTTLLIFSTSTVEESKNDDIRFPYNKWNIWEEDYR